MTTELLGKLAADLLDALATADQPLTGQREHPAVAASERDAVLHFWQAHGVAGMVLRIYSPDSLCNALGQSGCDHLAASAAHSQHAAMALLAAPRTGRGHATDAQIAVAPFKGPTEAVQLYGDFGVRTTSDLDLLVSPQQRDSFLELLQAEGWVLTGEYAELGPMARRWYCSVNHALVLRSPAGVMLDLHWQVNEYPLLNLDESRWLEQYCQPARIVGKSAWQLMPVARYLALLSHAARSEWFLLKWWTDLVRARRLAVMAVGEIELVKQLGEADALSLDASWQRAWASMRAGIPQRLGDSGYWLLSEEQPDPLQYFAHMWFLRQNIRYRLVLCWREAVRWDDLRQCPLPDALFPLYFFMRVPLMIWRRLAAMVTRHQP